MSESNQGDCKICSRNTQVTKISSDPQGFEVICWRCGTYCVYEPALDLKFEDFADLRLLAGAVRNLYEYGKKVIFRVEEDIKTILDAVRIPTDPWGSIDLLLKYIAEKSRDPSTPHPFMPDADYPLLFARDGRESGFYVTQAIKLNLLEDRKQNSYRLTLDGWKRIAELKKLMPDSNKAFVAMWFAREVDDAWRSGIKPALIETGYDGIRIDLEEHNEKICDQILAEIRKSVLVVADFTGQRQGVYFEAGFAMGLGTPVIRTCRQDHIDDLHFDTRQYSHVVWADPEELKTKLIHRIEATVPIRPSR
jgi:nucleoside 2-deoxyribosyltransferase